MGRVNGHDDSPEAVTEVQSVVGEPSPFFLVIDPDEKGPEGNIGIDLDEPGWLATNQQHFRRPGYWFLVHKGTMRPTLTLRVNEGDQPYFTKRHIGFLSGGSGEIVSFGIGKKLPDGSVMRLWLLPNGMIVGGEDVEDVAIKVLRGG